METATPLRVLIVEDSVDDFELLLLEIKRSGYEPVYERVDTLEALDAAIGRQQWDVVLADYTMPHFSGSQALTTIRAHGLDVPFIFVSGTIGEDVAVSAMKAGAQDYIVKGSLKRLVPAIERELHEVRDRREHARAEAERRMSEARFRNILTIAADAVVAVDDNQRIVTFNRGAEQIFGYRAEEAVGQLLDLLLPSHYVKIHRQHVRDFARVPETARYMNKRNEICGRRKDGTEFPAEASISKFSENGNTAFTVILRDITEHKRDAERLHHLAYYDALTGLPNRALLHDRLKQAMIEASRHERLVGVVLLGLDRFKTINDSLGRGVGDLFLKAVAERLASCVREGDTVGRFGGDEFALILADMRDLEDAARVAPKILDAFAQPFHVDGHELFTSASLGMTLYPGDDDNIENLLRNADTAMFRAKESGGNVCEFYSADMASRAHERLELEHALRRASDRQEFLLHYQPVVDLKSGGITGVEALVRWQHPERGLVPPLGFIALAEEINLIQQLGEWVLRTACEQCRSCQAAGLPSLRIAVNISPRQFLNPNLPEAIAAILSRTGLAPALLDLEITEGLLMQNTETVRAAMHKLGALGLQFSVDDFGTGFSSLSYLKRLPIRRLKIDRSFVRDIATDANDAAIVTAIISMAHSLGMEVIAEGVETRAQLDFLLARDCDAAQGYYFSRPLPAEAMASLVGEVKSLLPRH